jgi:hypothetical protein
MDISHDCIYENIWFDGGAWTCAWGAGVIQYLRKHYPSLLYNYKNLGGYSAGGFLALNVYLNFEEPDFWYHFHHETHGLGKYHLWSEEVANRCCEFDQKNNKRLINDNKISLIVYSTKSLSTIIRNNWNSKEDFVNFTKGTVHIPLMCGNIFHHIDGVGWSMDGALTQRKAPDTWKNTLTISPWKKEDKFTIAPSKFINPKLLVVPDFDLCKKIFDQGIEDAQKWCTKYL